MNKIRSVNRYIGLSIFLHTLICVFLFLAIIHKQLPQAAYINPLNKPMHVPAPVKLIQQPPSTPAPTKPDQASQAPLDIDPPGMPNGLAISMSELPPEALLANKKPGYKKSKKSSTATQKKESSTITPIPTAEQHRTEQPAEQTPPLVTEQKQATTSIQDQKSVVFSEQKIEKKSTDTPLTKAVKELTLADLFKNAHQALSNEAQSATTEETDGENGPVGDIVISEGSLKYYSLWSKFLSHLNDAARFNRRGGKDIQVRQWLQSGAIKKEALFAIDIATNGQVVNVALLSSSGHPPFDSLCIADIWSAAPYPPLPASINRPTARFQVKAFF